MTEYRDPEVVSDDSTDETEELVESIETTRSEMTDTVEAIGDRLDPSRIVEDAKETVREATVGRVETMTGYVTDAAGEAGQTIQETGGSLVETIRRNPLPAAMAAVGIGWLITHRSSTPDRSRMAWDRDTYRGRSSMHDPRSGSWQVGGAMDEGRSNMPDVGQAAEAIGERAEAIGERARTSGSELVDTIEREPLAAGAVAVAVGAAIGLMLPATRMEQDVLGPAGQRVLDTVEDAASSRLQAGREGEMSGSTGSTGTTSSTSSFVTSGE